MSEMASRLASSPQLSQVYETCFRANTAASHPTHGVSSVWAVLSGSRPVSDQGPSFRPLSPPSHRVLSTRLREEKVGLAWDLLVSNTSCKSPSTVTPRLGHRYVALPRRARLCMATNLAVLSATTNSAWRTNIRIQTSLFVFQGRGARITAIVLSFPRKTSQWEDAAKLRDAPAPVWRDGAARFVRATVPSVFFDVDAVFVTFFKVGVRSCQRRVVFCLKVRSRWFTHLDSLSRDQHVH